jgi:hypothetical protein
MKLCNEIILLSLHFQCLYKQRLYLIIRNTMVALQYIYTCTVETFYITSCETILQYDMLRSTNCNELETKLTNIWNKLYFSTADWCSPIGQSDTLKHCSISHITYLIKYKMITIYVLSPYPAEYLKWTCPVSSFLTVH